MHSATTTGSKVAPEIHPAFELATTTAQTGWTLGTGTINWAQKNLLFKEA